MCLQRRWFCSNSPVPTVGLASTDGVEASQAGSFTITRDGNLGSPLTLTYTLDGSAYEGSDFYPIPHTVTIPAGQTSIAIAIANFDNGFDDGYDSLSLTLDASSSYQIGSSPTQTLTIYEPIPGVPPTIFPPTIFPPTYEVPPTVPPDVPPTVPPPPIPSLPFQRHLAERYADPVVIDALVKLVTVDNAPIVTGVAPILAAQRELPLDAGDALAGAVRRCLPRSEYGLRESVVGAALKTRSEPARKAVLEALRDPSDVGARWIAIDALRLSPGDPAWLQRARPAMSLPGRLGRTMPNWLGK